MKTVYSWNNYGWRNPSITLTLRLKIALVIMATCCTSAAPAPIISLLLFSKDSCFCVFVWFCISTVHVSLFVSFLKLICPLCAFFCNLFLYLLKFFLSLCLFQCCSLYVFIGVMSAPQSITIWGKSNRLLARWLMMMMITCIDTYIIMFSLSTFLKSNNT